MIKNSVRNYAEEKAFSNKLIPQNHIVPLASLVRVLKAQDERRDWLFQMLACFAWKG